MAIADKLIKIANNTPLVCASLSTEKAITGNSIAVSDVSSVKHNLRVKLVSKNLIDYTELGKKYSGLAGATLEDDILKVEHNLGYATGYVSANYSIPNVKELAGKTITISAQAKSGTGAEQAMIRILFTKPNGSAIGGYTDIYCHTKSIEFTTITATGVIKEDMPDDEYALCIMFYANAGGASAESGISYYKDVQVEISTAATPYTPYREEFSGVNAIRCGKNLFDISKITNVKNIVNNGDGTITVTGNAVNTGKKLSTLCPNLKTGDVAVISLRIKNDTQDGKERAYIYLYEIKKTWGTMDAPRVITQEMLDSVVMLYARWYDGTGITGVGNVSEVQVELNNTHTEYEAYIEPQTAAANSEGVVEGLTSISPNMTITTDDNSAAIGCTYKSSSNPAANEKFIELQNAFANAKEIIKRAVT